MNIFISVIWLLCIIGFIYLAVLDIQLQSQYLDSKTFAVEQPTAVCKNSTDLPQLTNLNSSCCVSPAGELTGNRLYSGGLVPVEISNIPTFYTTVCQTACSEGIKPGGSECKGENSGLYEECIEALKPEGCKNSANPVARIGNQLWYVKYYTTENCSRTKKC